MHPKLMQPAEGKKSNLTRPSNFRFVKFQADAAKADATKTETAAPTATETKPADASAATTKPTEYEPLDKVRDEIRERLATELARKERDTLLAKLERSMHNYVEKKHIAEIAAGKNAKTTYAPFPMEQLALEARIGSSDKLSLVTQDALVASEIGASLAQGDQREFATYAISDRQMIAYQPKRTSNAKFDYLIWKTESRGEEVPTLDNADVKAKAIKAWKSVRARELARKKAQEYVELAKQRNQSLHDLQTNDVSVPQAIKINSFSWMMFDNSSRGGSVVLSRINGLDRVGTDFMNTVFNLKTGEFGAALNEPQNTAYAIQALAIDAPSDKQDDYLKDVKTPNGYSQYVGAMQAEMQQAGQAMQTNMRQMFGLKINRPLKSYQQESE